MKRLLLGTAGLLAMSCQPQAQNTAAEPAAAPVSLVGSAAAAPLKPHVAVALAPISNLAPQWSKMLLENDLSAVLQTVHGTDAEVLNGFFGPDHYRIEFVVTDARRDPARPTVYYLQGQDRYKGVITPFAGTFTVSAFGEQPFYTVGEVAEAAKNQYELINEPNYYTTTGTFVLHEDSTRRGAGVFKGQLALDWHKENGESLQLHCRNNRGSSQGGNIKYEGTWTNSTTHRTFPVVWVEDVLTYNAAKEVLADFNVGERGIEVNPKYTRLGWQDYWENDEWWAEPKRQAPVASVPVPGDMTAAPAIVADSVPTRQ